jgi:hypothetical protein
VATTRDDRAAPARSRARIAVAAAAFALLAGAGCGEHEASPGAASAQPTSGPVPTAQGLYRVSAAPEAGAIPLGVIHGWIVTVEGADGAEVVPTRLAFDGGMPQHGHGFVTAPRVTAALGGGRYRVEGVKFHMGGDWTLRVEVVAPQGADVAVIHVRVGG